VINWGPYYIKATKEALDGSWKTGPTRGGRQGRRDRHGVDLRQGSGRGEREAREGKAGLKDGSLVIWKGPIVGSDGKEILAKDAVADDKFLKGITFYVKGVEGKVPSGDKK